VVVGVTLVGVTGTEDAADDADKALVFVPAAVVTPLVQASSRTMPAALTAPMAKVRRDT
jgi:hypothetical protein